MGQSSSHGQFVRQRHTLDRHRQRRAAAAGDENQADVIRLQPGDAVQNLIDASDAVDRRFIDGRRPRGMEMNLRERSHAIRGDVDPAVDFGLDDLRAERGFHTGGHPGPGFPAADHENSPRGCQGQRCSADDESIAVPWQCLLYQPGRIHRVDTGPPDGDGRGGERGHVRHGQRALGVKRNGVS